MKNPGTQRGFRYPQRIKLLIMIGVFFVFGTLGLVHSANAAVVCWDGGGGGDTNWNTAANWEGNTQPGSGDVATFDSTDSACSGGSPNNDVTINVNPNVLGINITNYTGTITQSSGIAITLGSSGYAQSASGSTFTGGNSAIDINNGAFTLSNGAFTPTSGSFTIERNFTVSGGTLNMTGKTLTFDGDFQDSTVLTCTGSLGGSVIVVKTSYTSSNFTLASGCSATVTSINTSGSVTVDGTLTYTGTSWVSFNVTNNNVLDHQGTVFNIGGSLTNDSSATLTYTGTNISIDRNLDYDGTFNLSGKTITFSDSDTSDDSILTCTGTLGGSVVVAKTTYTINDFTLASGCTATVTSINTVGAVTVDGTLNHTGTTFTVKGHFTINGTGVVTYTGTNVHFEKNFTQGGTWNLTGKTVTFDGAVSNGDSILTCSGSLGGSVVVAKTSFTTSDFTLASGCTATVTSVNTVGAVTVDGTFNHTGSTFDVDGSLTNNGTGVITFSGTTVNIERNFTQNGTWDLTGKTINMTGSGSDDDAILVCGSSIEGNLTINKSSSSANTTLASNCTVTGNFTRTNGPMLNPSSPFTLTVQGNFSMSTTDAFGGANLTLELSGSNAQTVTQNAGTIAGPLTINKTGSNAATLTTALVADGTCDIVEGIFDIAGNNFTCGSTFTVQDGGTLRLEGGETTVTSPTLATGSTVVYNGTAGPYASLKLGNNYHHLTFDGADSWTMAATTDINGALTITTGTVVAPATLTVAGNFTNSGTFTHSSGTVTLDGTDQTLSGATTFNNFTKTVASAATLTLPASTTQTIDGTLTLKGLLDNLLSLRSSAPGTQWSIDAPGIKNIEYLDIKDASSENSAISCTTGCINSGNNTNWTFPAGSAGAPDTTSPEPIQDLIAIVQEDPSTPSGQAVLLTWTNSPDSDFLQVRIYRSINTSFTPSIATEIAQLQGSLSSPSSYIDTNVELNITYTYKILTEDIIGNLQTGLFYPSVSITVVQAEEEPPTSQEPPITPIIDGGLITTADSFDIYIVKLIGTKKFKRLILNPAIFDSYAHLRWDEVRTVSQEVQDTFILSQLIIEVHEDGSVADPKVYEVSYSPGSDTGQRQWINMTPAEFEQEGYDWDAIYHINHTEASSGFYVEGAALAAS